MKNTNNVKSNIIYNTIGNTIFMACNWAITLLVVWLSGYKDAGILSLSASFANSLYAIASFGMRGYQASDYEYKFSNETYIKSRVLTCSVGYILYAIFILLNDYTLYIKSCILVYLLYKTIEAFDDVYYGAIQREWSMKEIGISYLMHGIISLICFLIGFILFDSLLVSIILMLIGSILITLLYDRRAYLKNYTYKKNTDSLKNLLLACAPLVIYVFLYNNVQVYPRYLLEKMTSEEVLGIYSSVTSPVLILPSVISFFFNPLLNLFAEYIAKDKKKEHIKLINKSYLLIIIFGIIGVIYIYYLGDLSLKLLLGKSILKYSNLLYSTLIVTLLMATLTFNNMILTVARKFHILIWENILCILASIISANIFIPKYELYGVNKVLMLSFAIGILFTLKDVYDYNKKESSIMKKIKQFIINFAIKHKKIVLKIFPSKFVLKIEAMVNKNFNDFERTKTIDSSLKDGINLVAHIKGQYGLGQGGRSLLSALQTTDINFGVVDVNNGDTSKHGDTEFDDILTKDFDYNINLFHVQPYTSFEIGLSQIGKTKNLKGRYNIGYWVFETEDIPKKWSETFKYVNEIWTPSDFATEAFKKISPVPVYTVPYGLKIVKDESLTRKDFDIPEDKFSFLIMYDPSSLAERKNPKATIDAYLKAFKDNDDVCLVVVLNRATDEQINALKKELEGVKNLTLINKTLPKPELYALISLCDVYVSLHRSEGFGLIMAEAMFLDTVCVATGYSGNLQFMNKDNSCLVKYKMIDVDTSTQIVYEKGNKWADADVDDACKYMKKLFKDKKYYKKLQKNAKEYVLKYLTPEHCGEVIKERYNDILDKVGNDSNE